MQIKTACLKMRPQEELSEKSWTMLSSEPSDKLDLLWDVDFFGLTSHGGKLAETTKHNFFPPLRFILELTRSAVSVETPQVFYRCCGCGITSVGVL